jgi:hypothetical protein
MNDSMAHSMPIYRYGLNGVIFILSDDTWQNRSITVYQNLIRLVLLTRYFDRNVTISPRNNGIRCNNDHELAEGWQFRAFVLYSNSQTTPGRLRQLFVPPPLPLTCAKVAAWATI